MTPPTESDAKPLPPWRVYFWPALVIGLLVGQIVLMAIMVLVATRDQGFAVEPDYYQKALHWDAHAQQLRDNQRLAWQTELSLGDTMGPLGERDLICTLLNSDGQKLDGAQIDVITFPHARGTQRHELALTGEGDGRYVASTRFPRDGLWEFQLKITRGPEVFTQTIRRDVYPPGESRPWRP